MIAHVNHCLIDESYHCSGPFVSLHFHKGKLSERFMQHKLRNSRIWTDRGGKVSSTWNLVVLTRLLMFLMLITYLNVQILIFGYWEEGGTKEAERWLWNGQWLSFSLCCPSLALCLVVFFSHFLSLFLSLLKFIFSSHHTPLLLCPDFSFVGPCVYECHWWCSHGQ